MSTRVRLSQASATPEVDYCSTRVAAQRLGVSLGTVQQMVESGRLQAWKTQGGHRRILVDSVERMLVARSARLATPTRRMRLVVVEDDPIARALYEHSLRKWALPIDFSLADDGFAGLLAIGRAPTDLLITDLMMPGMDGLEMIRRLREQAALAPMDIIVVSGLRDEEIAARGGLPPGVVRMGKPVPLAELKGYLIASVAAQGRRAAA